MRSNHAEALAISTEATKILLERGETNAALELLEVIIQASAHQKAQEAEIEHIVGLLPAPHDTSFLTKICKTTQDPELYSILARVREDEEDISESLVRTT